MPPLKAFGHKWRIGSDDLVFPYIFSILLRLCWFVVIGVVLLTYDQKYFCHDEKLLKIYLFILTSIHLLMVMVEITIVVISSMGTIANPEPRRRIHVPLYIQMTMFVFEFGWDIVGVVWAFDPDIDCHRSHSVLILSRIILVWNLLTSSVVGVYLIARLGVCQMKCYDLPSKMRYEQFPPQETYGDARRLSSLSSGGMIQHKRQRLWQWRLQRIFWWMNLEDSQQNVFADVSSTLADAFAYFRGYVPSDIVAGIALLAMEESKETDDGSDDCKTKQVVNFHSQAICKHYNRCVHYMKFSLGAYGYPAYLYSTGIVRGLLNLTENCKLLRCWSKSKPLQVEDMDNKADCCSWNFKSLLLTTGIEMQDILYTSFSSKVFCPAFYVAYDHKYLAIVVAIRGSLSLHDFMTDLSSEPQMFSTCEDGDIYGHKGMLIGAHAVQLQIESHGILERAFAAFPNYRLVILGHSLGAATASLLAIILKPKFPNLHCFAFSPPGCVININAVPYSRSFITSVIIGNDIIPRLSAESFEAFSVKVLDCLQTASIPKYRIFLDSFFFLLGCFKQYRKIEATSATEMAINKDRNLIKDFDVNYEEDDIYDIVADAKLLQDTDKVTGKKRVAPRQKISLFIPGRIIHITPQKPIKRCCGLYSLHPVQGHWTAHSEFSNLTLPKNCFKHHTPDVVLKYLLRLQSQEHTLD